MVIHGHRWGIRMHHLLDCRCNLLFTFNGPFRYFNYPLAGYSVGSHLPKGLERFGGDGLSMNIENSYFRTLYSVPLNGSLT